MGEVVQFIPRPNPNRFQQAYDDVRRELRDLVPFAKSGGPIIDHHEDYGCSESNPDDGAA